MGQRSWATLLSVAILVIITVLNSTKPAQNTLVASNFAIYDQLKHLAPEGEKVTMLIPFGQDSHTFQATPKDITRIIDAVAFFYSSKGMDRWVGKMDLLRKAPNTIDLSKSITWIHEEDHETHEEEGHDKAGFDPHYWLDVKNQSASAKIIYEKLQRLFPKQSKEMEKKYSDYLLELKKIEALYEEGLRECRQRKLFVTHDAFSYLEQRGFFSVESVVGLAPESSPSPTRMEEIIEKLKESGVKTIFFESFISDRIAIAIAHEVGISVDVLDTLATISAEEAEAGVSYKELMLKNLKKMQRALECQ